MVVYRHKEMKKIQFLTWLNDKTSKIKAPGSFVLANWFIDAVFLICAYIKKKEARHLSVASLQEHKWESWPHDTIALSECTFQYHHTATEFLHMHFWGRRVIQNMFNLCVDSDGRDAMEGLSVDSERRARGMWSQLPSELRLYVWGLRERFDL